MKVLFATLLLSVAAPVMAQTPDLARPAADTALDAARKPADMVAFAKLAPGMKVADIIPGGGYFTRVFAQAVGPTGKVVAIIPPQAEAAYPEASKAIKAMPTAGYPNVSVMASPTDPALAGTLDVAWTAQNYHDIRNDAPPEQLAGFNKAVFAALKPGGTFVVVDHAAPAGTTNAAAKPLHRVDPALVKADLTAAGFVFDGESQVLRNPGDPGTGNVFDPAVRGKTDQFAYRFRKP